MAKEDFEVRSRTAELSSYIEALDRKIEELNMLQEDSLESEEEVKAMRNAIQEVKKDQEDIKKRFSEFMGGVSLRIEGFKKEEDELRERWTELMLKYGKEGYCTFMFVDHMKIIDSYLKVGGEESDEGLEVLKEIKDRAAKLEALFSDLLVVFMNMLSSNGQEAVVNFAEANKSNATNRIVAALKRAEKNAEDKTRFNLIELLEKCSASKVDTALDNELRENKVEEGPIIQLLDEVCQEILLLDTILWYLGLPESKILKEQVLSTLERGLKECEEALKGKERGRNVILLS